MFIWGALMLDVSNIDLKYGQSQILFDISLSAEVGKITAVMGNNGVGKTSLLRRFRAATRFRVAALPLQVTPRN